MVRQEIWEEMKKAKTYQLSCLYYVDKKRKFNRNYNMWIIGVAAIGAPPSSFCIGVHLLQPLRHLYWKL